MQHHVDMRIVLNVSVDIGGHETIENATEQVEQEVHAMLEALDGYPCVEFGKPSIRRQVFLVADIETTNAQEVS